MTNNQNPMTPPSTVVPPIPAPNPQDASNFSGTLQIGAVSAGNTGRVIPPNVSVGTPQRLAAQGND